MAYGQVKETHTGNSRCRQPHCKTCTHVTTIRSTTTGKTFKVKASGDCCTKNVVYVIECKRCAVQYFAETENALRVRLIGHRSDINHRRTDRPMVKHFCQSDHSINDLTIMAVEKIHRNDVNLRRRKESHWISILSTLIPDGLNINP